MEIVKVLAPNPGPYTGPGTNTYVIHDETSAMILDPGPVIESHRVAILEALGELVPAGVVVTHNHPDHAPLANPLAEQLEVAAFGFAPGPDFSPDVMVADGDVLTVGTSELTAVHTPGHTWDHLCFLAGTRLFTGDHIMGGSTVIIEDAAAYFDSLYRVAALEPELILPGHGDEIRDARGSIAEYIAHRLERERQIIAAVGAGAGTVNEIAEAVYQGIDPRLMAAATAQVEVQLQKLLGENRLSLDPSDASENRIVLVEKD